MTSAPPFRPLPLLGHPHLQTILGLYLKSSRWPLPVTTRVVPLSGGDALLAHDSAPPSWQSGEPIAVLVHGLTGSHRSAAIVALGRKLLKRGVRVVRLDLRGAGDGFGHARGFYHAGCSADVRAAMTAIHALEPQSPLWLAGVSLGGNVALKMAGEAAAEPVPGLAKVAAIAPPIDLNACIAQMELPGNRVYERHFLTNLLADARRRHERHPDLPPPAAEGLSLRRFDDLYTAPFNGFAGVADYYTRASSLPLLERIAVPTLLLTARDDPFIAVAPFDRLTPRPGFEVRITPRGGHVGYLGWDGTGHFCWGEQQIADWLVS